MRTLGLDIWVLPGALMGEAALGGGDGNSGAQGHGDGAAIERHGVEHASAEDIADEGATDRLANVLPRTVVFDAEHPALLALAGAHRQHQPGALHGFDVIKL